MLNWDDPLAAALPAARHPAPPPAPFELDAEPSPRTTQASAHDTRAHVRPGRGLVANDALMTTAGAAPVVEAPCDRLPQALSETSRAAVARLVRRREVMGFS